jgi:hypothetical protein
MDNRTKEVLAWVNTIRKRLSLKPLDDLVPGQPGNAHGCPIANSLAKNSKYRCCVYEHVSVQDDDNGYVISEIIPEHVLNWIEAFDKGKYENYERYS